MADTAFCDCLRLGLSLPPFVAFIGPLSTRGDSTAWKCGLPSIVIPPAIAAISDGGFFHCDDLVSVLFRPNSSIISINGFSFCPRLMIVTFSAPPSLHVICGFDGTALPRIEIPASVRKLDGFSNCLFLAEVIIKENSELTELTGLCCCPLLREMIFPTSLQRIISGFNECARLARLEIPRSLQLFKGGNDCILLTEIVFDANGMLREIDGFSRCAELSVITIPASVEVLRGFYACPRVATVSFLPDSRVCFISAFIDCNSLSCFDIPPFVEDFGDVSRPYKRGSFSGCVSLSQVTIPPSVKAVTGFNGCSALAEIFFADNGALGQIKAFNACTSLVTVTIPPSVTTVEGFCGCTHLREVIFTQGGLLLINGFGSCFALEEVTIPASVQKIGIVAFYACTALSRVTFADGSMLNAMDGFRGCTALVRIELPPSVTSLATSAFAGSTALAEFIFLEGTKITQIGFFQEWLYENDVFPSVRKQAQRRGVFLTFRTYGFLKQQRRCFHLIQATRFFKLDIKDIKDINEVKDSDSDNGFDMDSLFFDSC
jgi:hypothetical protein